MKFHVYGGTQFMGRLTVEALLDAGHAVVLFNRGCTRNPFEGRANVDCVVCDRTEDRDGFKHAVRNAGPSDVVIDFSGLQPKNVRDAVDALNVTDSDGRLRSATRHYIYVSSDSVYWAKIVPRGGSAGRKAGAGLHETQARDFRFRSQYEAHAARCRETAFGKYHLRYGENKLGCERVLNNAWRSSRFPYTILRLPDVYGPYDNLGGMWELVRAIEERRPIPAGIHQARMSRSDGQAPSDPKTHRFSWAFAEDVRDAILTCAARGACTYGVTMHIAHEEAVTVRDTACMVADAMGVSSEDLRFDDSRESAMPSSDYGFLSVSASVNLLRPWRPTPIREAVRRSVSWFLQSSETRRYHRVIHREPRHFGETKDNRRLICVERREVPRCWSGAQAAQKAACISSGPVVFSDSFPNLTGQAVLGFMQRLMEQAGDSDVICEQQQSGKVTHQNWPLRDFVNDVLPRSSHTTSYRLETTEVLTKTDLLDDTHGPLSDLECEEDHELDAAANCVDERVEMDSTCDNSDASTGDVSTSSTMAVKAKYHPIARRAKFGPGVVMRGWPSGLKDSAILGMLKHVGDGCRGDGEVSHACVAATPVKASHKSSTSVSAGPETASNRNHTMRQRRSLRVGGVGARAPLRRADGLEVLGNGANGGGGFWDCVLLGRRFWRIFPPTTSFNAVGNGKSGAGKSSDCAESQVTDCFPAGPDDWSIRTHVNGVCAGGGEDIVADMCWECEQAMGDAVVVPAGWWYQSYDDNKTLSISATCRWPQHSPTTAATILPETLKQPEGNVQPSTLDMVIGAVHAKVVIRQPSPEEGEEIEDFYEIVD